MKDAKKRSRFQRSVAMTTLALFTCAVPALFPPSPAFATDSTHISSKQQKEFSDTSWIEKQNQLEKQIEQTFQNGNYTADTPYVVVDPYGNNPLSALIMFKTELPTKVQVIVEIPSDKSGEYDAESTFCFSFEESTTTHYIPVYALFDGDNIVTLTVTDTSGTKKEYSVAITTKIPDAYNTTAKTIQMDKGNDNIVKGLNFVSYVFGAPAKIVAYDFNGNYRAIFTNSGQSKIYDLPNGHIAFEDNNVLHGLYYTSGFLEVDMMGKVYQHYLVNGIHHEFIQLENGNWLVDGELPNANTSEDYFVELDNQTGTFVRDWWLKDSMKLTDYVANPYYEYNREDWAHVNSFVQIPGQDAIWYSARQNDGLYKLNLTTNQIDAIIAEDDKEYTDAFREKRLTPVITQKDGSVISVDDWWKQNKKLNPSGKTIDWHNPDDPYFKIENTPFEYPYGQHAVSLLPNGDIFVFDNGDGRSKDPNKMITSAEELAARKILEIADKNSDAYKKAMATNYSRAVIYRYNEQAGTVEQIWQYGKERGMELYSMYICDVDYLGPNHYLIDFGGALTGSEKQTNSPFFGKPYARIIELLDGNVINEFQVDNNCYRAERLDPYFGTNKEYELNKVQGVQKGSLLMNRAVPSNAKAEQITMKIGQSEYVSYNGGQDMDCAPYIDKNNRTMVPLRFISEALNANVSWNSDNKEVTINANDTTATLKIGSNQITVNDKVKTIDSVAVIINNRTMIPLRAISETLGWNTSYEEGTITVKK